jgi:tetratricopeptide (TPR) repeat protein
MRNCFPIVLAVLFLSGSPVESQTITNHPEIRKFYLYLDSPAGDLLLNNFYRPDYPEYIRLNSYKEFLHALIFQSRSNFDRYLIQSDTWLQNLDRLKSSNVSVSAAIAEVRLFRAVLAAQFSEYKTSAKDLLASYKIVSKSGSDFNPADRNKLSGILGVLFQQVPEQYGKYLRLLGIHASGLSGLNGLERYYSAASAGSVERTEGYLLLVTSLKEFSKDPAAAWNFVKAEGLPMLDNPLVRYQSALAALKAGDCESALKLLEGDGKSNDSRTFPFWNYQLGRCKLYRNDPDAAACLEKFINLPGGDNYRHRALLLTGWFYLIHGQKEKTQALFTQMKNLSGPYTPYDRQALSEASENRLPDPDLLKVRILFDGGYYDPCLATCKKLMDSGRLSEPEVGELLYRKGRCEQRLGNYTQAINSYIGVVDRADVIRNYTVPNAALQLGDLYKKSGQIKLARKYYNVCLEWNKYGFREGISRQAEMALKELGN